MCPDVSQCRSTERNLQLLSVPGRALATSFDLESVVDSARRWIRKEIVEKHHGKLTSGADRLHPEVGRRFGSSCR